MTIRYRSSRPLEVDLRATLRDLTNERRRIGYRRLFILLRRDGEPSGINCIYRLYREEGFFVRKRKARRRAVGTRAPIPVEAKANARQAMDFVHAQLATAQKLRVLTVASTFSRYVPVLDPRRSYPGEDVVQTLERACRQVGYPKTVRVNQGTESVSRDLDLCAYAKGVTLDLSRPGKPTGNAFIEAFNGRFRAECLNQRWFLILANDREMMEDWRRGHNEVRPHGAIGNKVPIALMNQHRMREHKRLDYFYHL